MICWCSNQCRGSALPKVESYFCSSIEYRVRKVEYRVWKLEYRLDFLQRQWKSRVYLTFSLLSDSTFHNGSGKVESTSLSHFTSHFLTSLLFDSTLYNGSGKVESTSLSHFTSLRLDFLQRQWKSRVYLTFHFTSLRLDFLQRQWKSRVYLTFSLHFSPILDV